ncbi:matrixin family metalloprotease [bacterium]|nr:matrixin family metalloprotease [bacterium]
MTQEQNNNNNNNQENEYLYEGEREKEPERKKYVPSTAFIIILIIIGLFVIYCKTILPTQLYDKAKKDYDSGNYEQAFRIFNVFSLINPFDEELIKYQAMTLGKMDTNYTNQKKLYDISQYDEDNEGEEIARQNVALLKDKILKEAGDNYIENSLFNNRVIRWNLSYKPLTFAIVDTAQTPNYYKNKVYEAFSEWQADSKELVTFKEIQNPDAADIVVYLTNSIPDSVKEYYDKYQVGNTIPVLKNDNLKQMLIHVRARDNNNRFFLESEFANIIKHEVGHALGIWGHSPSPNDIMYYRADNVIQGAREKRLSNRDINTLKLLYKLYPDTINVEIPAAEQDGLIYHYIVTKDYKHNSEYEIRRIMEELNANRNDITKWVDLAIEYSMNERYEQSNTILFKALPLIPRDLNNLHVIYYNIAANYYNMRKYNDAQSYVNRAKRLKNDYDTKVLDAFIKYKLDNYADAEKELYELFTQKPSDTEVAIKLADLYRKTKRMNEAKEVLVKLVKYNPDARYDRRVLKYKVGKIYWGLASGI